MHSWSRRSFGPAILLLALGIAAPLAAQPSPKPPTNDDCLACHQDPEFKRSDGRTAFVDPQKFGASIHGGLECVTCHTDLAAMVELPHAERLQKVDCSVCHTDPVAQYQASIHGQVHKDRPEGPAATCVDCHGTHDITPSADPTSRTYQLNLPDTCGHCHGNPDVIKRGHIEIGDILSLYQDSIHGRALTRSGLTVAPNCSDCHGVHDIQRLAEPTSKVNRRNVPATCGRCHEGVKRQYDGTVHGTQLAGGNPTAPACHDCHTAHDIQRAETERWQLDVVRECGTCHIESIRTYRDTFHGQVTALGYTRVAKCADCHTSHEIHPKGDPRSSIAQANVVATCKRCHEGASESFAKYDPHADKENQARNPFLYYTGRFMKNLLLFVFGFFGLHTILWFVREARHRRDQAGRAGAAGGKAGAGA